MAIRKNQISSDPHYFHENILKYEAMMRFRGGVFQTIEEMNDALVAAHNEHADDKTTSFILGDFCFGYGKKGMARTAEILSQLNGKIILVGGNHDHKNTRSIFKEQNHEVYDYYEFRDFETLVVMSHYPFAVWNKSHHGSVMMHGHSHGTYKAPGGRIIDVGWDVHGRVLDLHEAYEMAMNIQVYRENDHH